MLMERGWDGCLRKEPPSPSSLKCPKHTAEAPFRREARKTEKKKVGLTAADIFRAAKNGRQYETTSLEMIDWYDDLCRSSPPGGTQGKPTRDRS